MKVRPFHHQRPLAACALCYGAGVFFGVYLPYEPRLVWMGLILCAFGCVLLHRMHKRQVLGWMGAFLFLGLLLSGHASHPQLPQPGRYTITGVVAEELTLRPDGSAQGYLEQTVAHSENGEMALGRVYWTFVPEEENPVWPTDSQQVQFSGKIYHPSRQDNPYGFDFRMFLLEKGIQVGISGANELQIIGQGSRGLFSNFYQWRTYLSTRLELVFGDESDLPRALLLGEKYWLPQEVQDSFAQAGVAHVLSVSGMHVAMLAYCVIYLIPRRLGQRFSFVLVFLFLLVYCGMLGFPAPAVRAAVFVLLGRYRRILRRGKDWLSVVAAAFLLITLFSPMAMFSAGFQLSFGAVIGIFVVLPLLEKRFPGLRASRLGQSTLVSIAAILGLSLPSVQVFHQFSVIGLFLNPFICLVFMALLPLYAVLLVLGCISMPLAQTLAVPFHIITSAVTDFVTWAGQLPFATVRVPELPWYVVVSLATAFVLVSGFVVMKKNLRRALALALAVGSLLIWQVTLCRDVQYIQLAAGQSDAAIICDGRETVLIDVGEYGGDTVSYLQSTARNADTLVITHLHKDHCLGVRQLLDSNVKIGRVILPHGALDTRVDLACVAFLKEFEERQIPVYYMRAGQYFQTERCRFTAQWPMEGTVIPGQDANRYSLMLLCELDGVRLLSCGDGEGDFECYGAVDADVVKIAHHGSKDGTREAFLEQATPFAALITGNGYSETLPHPETLSRLEKYGVSVYNTGERGAVTLTCRDGRVQITPYLPLQEMP